MTAAFLLTLIQAACGFFAFSLFVKPLEEALGWSRGEIMAAFTFCFLSQGMVSPLVGRLVDRYGAKNVIATGAIIGGIGFVLGYLFYEF